MDNKLSAQLLLRTNSATDTKQRFWKESNEILKLLISAGTAVTITKLIHNAQNYSSNVDLELRYQVCTEDDHY